MKVISNEGVISAVLAVAAVGLAFAQETPKPNPLAGTWKLNVALSKGPDGAPPDMARLASRRRGGDRYGEPGQGGAPGLGGPFAEATPGGNPEATGAQPSMPGSQGAPAAGGRGSRHGHSGFGPIATMTVTVDAKEFRVDSADGLIRTMPLDGTPVQHSGRRYQAESRAKLTAAGVVITTTSPDGRIISETYALADDGSGRLVHTVDAKGGMNPPMTARWVYDRDAAVSTAHADAPVAVAAPAATAAPQSDAAPQATPATGPTPATEHPGR